MRRLPKPYEPRIPQAFVLKRLAVLLTATLAVAAAAIAAVSLSDGSSDREENERLLESLPAFPGAELVSVESEPYHGCEWPIPRRQGVRTTANYRAPSATTAEEIIEFYVTRLGGEWTYNDASIGIMTIEPGESGGALGKIPAARFVKEAATVDVSTENMVDIPGDESIHAQPAYDFAVSVDSEGTVERPYCD
jgi:hypothetical protein